MFDVTVIGNVGIDTNVYFSHEPNFDVEANFTENIDYVGNAGGYTTRGYAQLGYQTSFIGYVGKDFSGEYIRHVFTQDGIDTSAVFIDPAGTGRSVNFMYADGRRKNFYDGKSHMDLIPDLKVCEQVIKQSRLLHFHIPDWARALLPIAKKYKIPIASDLQDIVHINDPYRKDFIRFSDVLFFSCVNHTSPEPMMQAILEKYPNKILVAGLGSQGCALGTEAGIQYFPPVQMDAPVIDTNGAGDGLAVGFLSSYFLEKHDLEASVSRGQITARYTCTQKANTSNLISRQQLDVIEKVLRANSPF